MSSKPVSSGPTSRLFVALPIPASVKKSVAEACQNARHLLPFQKWVHPDDLHITVVFLGDRPHDDVDRISEAIRGASQETRPFSLQLEHLGSFGPPKAPTVLWTDVAGNLQALKAYQAEIQAALERRLGIETETRPYRPHVTLARRFAGETLSKQAWEEAEDLFREPLNWEARETVVYLSRMGQTPSYEEAAAVRFGQT